MKPLDAQRALQDAEAKVRDAEQARDRARDELDAALTAVGWRRMRGVFNPGATPRYTHVLYPDAAITAEQVVEVLEQQRKAAA
jgi:hypothetical protein